MSEFYIGDGFVSAKSPDNNPLVMMFIFLEQREKKTLNQFSTKNNFRK